MSLGSQRLYGKPDRCPSCGSIDIRLSVARGVLDNLMRTLSRVPWRCRACERRFYRHIRDSGADDVEQATPESGQAGPPPEPHSTSSS